MNSSNPRNVLTDRQAAQYIGMSESWLRISRMNGNEEAPPFLKIGRSVRYLREDLDQWLQGRRQYNTFGGQS